MLSSTRLRLLTVLLVATWSPGQWWCGCCGGGDSTAEAATEAATASEPAHACCLPPAGPPETPVAAGCGSDRCGNDDDSCGCLHGPSDARQPVAVAASSPDDGRDGVAPLAEAPGFVAPPVGIGGRVGTCRGSPQPLRPQTLLSLGCLLII